MKKRLGKPESGMTIIEILIVIALIGTIMTIVISNMFPHVDETKVKLAGMGASNIGQALQKYRMDNNRLPSVEEGLKALVEKPDSARNWLGPYIEEEKLKDPWQNPYAYEFLGGKNFKVISAGLDGEPGNDDDIAYPKEKEKSPE